MERQLLQKFYDNKTKIQIVLKNGRYYTGTIVQLSDTSFVFKDKFGNELPFDLSVLSYIDLADGGNRR